MGRSYTLVIDIRSYWHPGTGRGLGTQLDAVTHRSSSGLPALPGRHVKGLLRDAVHRYECFGGYDGVTSTLSVAIADQLFGPYDHEEKGTETWPGLLRVSDAMLLEAEAKYLAENHALTEGLYRSHFSTRIEHETGTAAEKTLRGVELVVPLTLYTTISTVPAARHHELEDRWPAVVREALPLLRAVGAHRSRGLGRAVFHLREETP